MIRLFSLQIYNFIFDITEEITKIELYKDKFDGFSYVNLKDTIEEIAKVPIKKAEGLQKDTLRPINISISRKLQLEKSNTDG